MSRCSRTSSITSLNRSVIDSIHDAGSPANVFRSCIDPKNLDLLDLSITEPDFIRFDTDIDGYVNGADVKDPLFASGLPQMTLAKLWALIDINHSGRLNHAQFTLLIQLVKECRQGIVLPEFLPGHLFQWLSAPSTTTKNQKFDDTYDRRNNRSVIGSISDAGSPADVFRSCLDAKNLDVLDMNITEPDFIRFDTDIDGYVNGADVKDPLFASGLPQMTLAKLWALIDINHSGRLNHAQFTLLIQLVKECRQGISLPEFLPGHLFQWLSAPSTTTKIQLPQNPRIDQLNEEINTQREERRKAEHDLLQLDADTSVKNSEIKNAEIELNTLTATVKQLRNQRVEAAKRLADLDDKILSLESQCEELTKRLKNEEERVNSVKNEIKSAEQNQESEQQIVEALRDELRNLDLKESQEQAALSRENAEMERIVDELTKVERHVYTNKEDVEKLEQLVNELTNELKEAESIESPTGNERILFKQFQAISSNGTVNVPSSNTNAVAPQRPAPPAAFDEHPLYDMVAGDPFKHDPFENIDHSEQFGFADPFGRSATGGNSADPFGSDPFGDSSFVSWQKNK